MKPVKLKDIIDELEMHSEEFRQFLNKSTGEIVTASLEGLEIAEDGEDNHSNKYLKWDEEFVDNAFDVVENWENYVELPSEYDIDEYNIMEEFCLAIKNESISNTLSNSIRGKGAFRRFKDNIIKFDIEEDWYKFREDALKQIAIDWCEENRLEYIL